MKKRGIAFMLAMILCISTLFTGCAQKKNPFVGTWKASYNMQEEMQESLAGYEDCFGELAIGFVLEFTEEEVTFHVDETAMDDFMKVYEDGLIAMLDKVLDEAAEAAGVSVEDFLAEIEMDREAYINAAMAEMDMDAIRQEIIDGFGEKITAEYKYTDDTITLTHDDGIEIWNYTLEGTKATIDMSGEMELEFVKQ